MDGKTLAVAVLCLLPAGCFDPAPISAVPDDEDGTMETDTATPDSETQGPGAETDADAGGTGGGEPDEGSDGGGNHDDTDDGTGGGEETGEPGDESGGPTACDGGVCLVVPDGWSGPVTLEATADDCDGAAAEFEAGGDLSVPASDCECDCGEVQDVACGEHTLTAWGPDPTCGGSPILAMPADPDSVCQIYTENLAVVSAAQHWTLTGEIAGGSCDPVVTVDIPPAFYGTSAAACAVGVAAGECDGDAQCYDAESICIWREGDHPCPSGFDEREVYFRGEIDDSRACSTCECGDPEGACEGSYVRMTAGYYCLGESYQVTEDCQEQCIGSDCQTYALSGAMEVGTPVAECIPSGGDFSGTAVGQDPVTVCC